MNRLALVGIVLSAIGLATLAFSDPVVRFLVFGGTGFGAPAGTSAGTFFNSTRVAATSAGRGTFGTSATTFITTLAAFGAAVVGLVLTATAVLVGGGRRESTSEQDHPAVS
ncbi:MAG: hypothetical protein LYZ69_01620 [Nitrososphaerales archaeon]|nr:hypothetical protein [Nitrososphaerales archaeon]